MATAATPLSADGTHRGGPMRGTLASDAGQILKGQADRKDRTDFHQTAGFMDKSTRKDDMLEVLAGFEDVALKEEKLGDCSQTTLQARIVSTSNQMDMDSLMPSRTFVTMFRIQVSDEKMERWEVLRRYSDFFSLHSMLAQAYSTKLPELPPKLLFNANENIAERHLMLDVYLRKLLQTEGVGQSAMLRDFLGGARRVARYGVRNYEYDSSQSEGNRYIRNNDL